MAETSSRSPPLDLSKPCQWSDSRLQSARQSQPILENIRLQPCQKSLILVVLDVDRETPQRDALWRHVQADENRIADTAALSPSRTRNVELKWRCSTRLTT